MALDNLVHLANQQLTRLHGRYLLQRKASEALEVEVVDTWQADAVRDTRTLSGGESFLVSLALALALSDLVSNPSLLLKAAGLSQYEHLIDDAIAWGKKNGKTQEQQVVAACDKLAVNFGAEILKIVPGRER